MSKTINPDRPFVSFRLVICLSLLLQGMFLSAPAPAQVKGEDARSRSERRKSPAASWLKPESKEVQALPPVNMQLLGSAAAFQPRPRSVTIDPGTPARPGSVEREGMGVAIPGDGDGKQGPARPSAPIPSGLQSPPASRTFQGDAYPFLNVPPNVSGAVGDNHVVSVTEERIITHDRLGQVLNTTTLDAFWATVLLGGSPPNAFWPKMLYDRFNDRFILVSVANASSLTCAILVAVSQTNDPLGTWNRYAIDVDAAATASGGKWADSVNVGFNKNWITVTTSLFGYGTQSGYKGPAVYTLNKAAAYDNTLSTVSVFEGSFATCLASATQETELGCGFVMVPTVTEDNTSESTYLVETWDSTGGQLRLSKITGTPSAPVLTAGRQFPQSTNSWEFDAQLIGTTGGYMLQRQQNVYAISGNRIFGADARIQNAVLRNGSVWAVHHVMLPTVPTAAGAPASTPANPDNHVGVQWWQINPAVEDSTTGTPPVQRAIIQDPTADNCHNGSGGQRTGASVPACPAPQGQFFAFPSIGVNQNNDVLIGYTRFSDLTLPKAAYSFRSGLDPLNTTRDSATYREGVSNYAIGTGSPARFFWGFYSASMVDPLNDTDFWTHQEFADYSREVFGPGNFTGTWGTWWGQVKPSSVSTTVGNLVISEFRLRGPAGPRDEFIELYNPGPLPLTVSTTDGSDGWAVAFSPDGMTATALASIPNGTTIPAKGHYLVVNNVAASGIAPYSLDAYPNNGLRPSNGDAMYTPDLADNGGVAIFRTANPANFNVATRMDSAGFAGIAAGLFKEGSGIPDITGTPTGQISFVRKLTTGAPQDTSFNENDFVFVDTIAETLGAQPTLGAPGPQNLHSPIQSNGPVDPSYIDAGCPFDSAVNPAAPTSCARERVTTAVPNGANGTLSIRRRFTNLTGAPVTRLRFRVVDITTRPAPPCGGPASDCSDGIGDTADLRVLSSTDFTGTLTAGGTTQIRGVTLEEPPTQPIGGGLNSTLSAVIITLSTPLDPNEGINISFRLGVERKGAYAFFINIEALN